jgi:hypothetical protein
MVVINRCGMCKMDGESIDHLIIHCKMVRVLCNAIFNQFTLS